MTKDDCPVIFHDDFIYSEENVSLHCFFLDLGFISLNLGLMMDLVFVFSGSGYC